jgi:hypothetical protein
MYASSADEFPAAAEEILNGYNLSIGGSIYRIIEIEFYIHSADHPDPYVHKSRDQLTCAQWYFHKRGGSYVGGTFRGLDITFAPGAYGGILIRAMIAPSGAVIEGPCNCVCEILRVLGANHIRDLVPRLGDVHTEPLALVACARVAPIYASARVGLNRQTAPDYCDRPYRYTSEPSKIKKNRKSIIAGMRAEGMTDEQITSALKKN